jgi:hypothetical protein
MGEIRNVYRILVKKPNGKQPLERPKEYPVVWDLDS